MRARRFEEARRPGGRKDGVVVAKRDELAPSADEPLIHARSKASIRGIEDRSIGGRARVFGRVLL